MIQKIDEAYIEFIQSKSYALVEMLEYTFKVQISTSQTVKLNFTMCYISKFI